MKSSRRKIITRVILFLLLGATVNVAVAWGFTLVLRPQVRALYDLGIASWVNSVLVRNQIQNAGTIPCASSFGAHLITINSNVQALLAGWPMHSLEGEKVNTWGGPARTTGIATSLRGAIRIGSPSFQMDKGTAHFLPIRPLWPGFSINTMLYSAILWVLFFTHGSVRRSFRRRRGLCPACAYPVGTSPVCTECGKPVSKRSAISDQNDH